MGGARDLPHRPARFRDVLQRPDAPAAMIAEEVRAVGGNVHAADDGAAEFAAVGRCGGRGPGERGAGVLAGSTMGAFEERPAQVGARRDEGDFIFRRLTNVRDPQPSRRVEAHAPGVAQAPGPDLRSGPRCGEERVVVRNPVWSIRRGPAHVDAYDLAPQEGERLGVATKRIPRRLIVSDPQVEHPVGPEADGPSLVDAGSLRDFQHDQFRFRIHAVPDDGEAGEARVNGRFIRVTRGVVDVEKGGRFVPGVGRGAEQAPVAADGGTVGQVEDQPRRFRRVMDADRAGTVHDRQSPARPGKEVDGLVEQPPPEGRRGIQGPCGAVHAPAVGIAVGGKPADVPPAGGQRQEGASRRVFVAAPAYRRSPAGKSAGVVLPGGKAREARVGWVDAAVGNPLTEGSAVGPQGAQVLKPDRQDGERPGAPFGLSVVVLPPALQAAHQGEAAAIAAAGADGRVPALVRRWRLERRPPAGDGAIGVERADEVAPGAHRRPGSRFAIEPVRRVSPPAGEHAIKPQAAGELVARRQLPEARSRGGIQLALVVSAPAAGRPFFHQAANVILTGRQLHERNAFRHGDSGDVGGWRGAGDAGGKQERDGGRDDAPEQPRQGGHRTDDTAPRAPAARYGGSSSLRMGPPCVRT